MLKSNLSHRIWPVAADANLFRNLTLAFVGSVIVALAAQVSVPMWPVSMTLQTLAVLAVGATFGAKLGALSMMVYALEGALGLPVFAGGQAGFYLSDGSIIASGGYVLGFVLAAYVTGWLIEGDWGNSAWGYVLAALIGSAVLYVPGLIWLGAWAYLVKGVLQTDLLTTTFAWGFAPFVFGDIVKAVIAGLGVGRFSRLSSR